MRSTVMMCVTVALLASQAAAGAQQADAVVRAQEALYRSWAAQTYAGDRLWTRAAEDYARALSVARLRGGDDAWARMAYHEVQASGAALDALRAGATYGGWGVTWVEGRPEAPEPWIQQDPADSLYRAAREALNRRQYERSAELFGQIRARYPRSGYVGDSFYFEAMALQRAGGTRHLEEAVRLLETMQEAHGDAATRSEARALQIRIQGMLARQGDADAARRVTQQAAAGCDQEDQELRAAALSALLQMDSEQAIPILKEVLRSRDECSGELRKRAVMILARHMDDEAEDVLLDLAWRNPDPDPEVREQAVFWLSQVDSPEALTALEAILSSPDVDESVQAQAIFGLSRHSSPDAVALLKAYAERSDAPAGVRQQAIFRLGRSEGGSAYLRELYGRLDDRDLKEGVLSGIARSDSQDNGAWLMARVRDGSEDVEIRKMALFWAAQTGAIEGGELRSMYGTLQSREMKEQVVFVLSRAGGEEAVDALMEIARNEEDKELKQQAIFWLGRSNDPRVADFLLEIIRGGGG